MNEIFIVSAEHEEHGSQKVSAFMGEAAFRNAYAFWANQDKNLMTGDDLNKRIQEAREDMGESGVFIHNNSGWGGPALFVVSADVLGHVV